MFNFGGGMLTGAEIERQIKKGNIKIYPYDPSCLNPNSYNLKLHPQLLIYKRNSERANVYPNTHTLIGFENNDIKQISQKSDIAADSEQIEILTGHAATSRIDSVADSLTNMINKKFDHINSMPIIDSNNLPSIDMMRKNETIEFEIPEEGYVLQPGVLYIGRTVETTFTNKFIPMINGRSSGGRLGISIHICAGFGDIGFNGTWTLEITCVEPVRIYPNVPIAQVCYFKPCGKVKTLYTGRYNGQEDATASRFFLK